jgi:hypothetical protein
MRRRDFLRAGCAGVAAAAASFGAGGPPPVAAARVLADGGGGDASLDIGSRVEMFVDRWLLHEQRDVTQRLHPPVRREVVLTLERPWEGPGSAYYTVFRDGAKVRMYYRGLGSFQKRQNPSPVMCYAESDDGIHFSRPSLGLVPHGGSTDNNIIPGVPPAADSFTPFLDGNPAAKPDERYKAVLSGMAGGQVHGFASADGVNWRLIRPEPISTDGSFDSLNVAFWDELTRQYRLFSRFLDVPGLNDNAARNRAVWQEGTTADWVRAIQSSTSADFLTWSPAVAHQYPPGTPREHFYTNATVRCPEAPHVLLSFPKRFVESRRIAPEAEHEFPGVSDAVFMSSRDGVHWDRTFGEAWLRPGPDRHNWTQRSNMPALGVLETGPDEFSMYVSEHYEWPTNRLRRVTVRRHGFASMRAGATPGEFTTKPLTFAGKQLLLNLATSAAGEIRVEIQDETGKVIEGFALGDCPPIYGDEIERAVTWAKDGDVGALAGRPVRLRFAMRDADLFALRFNV